MKKLIPIVILSITIVLSAGFLLFFDNEPQSLVSPLSGAQKVLGVNLWLPNLNQEISPAAPEISAKAAFFVETKSGQVFYSKNADRRLPVASLVKVMAVLIALEHKGMDDKYTVSEYAAGMEPDKMLLIAGEKLTLRELLYGVFLISANDASEVLAEGTTGKREQFIELMNKKAKQLGMENSYFVNPTGLDEDSSNSYSTAYDMAILTRYLIRHYPQVVDISQTPHIYLPITEDHQDYDMYTGINLVTTYPGVLGFKTGNTPKAGLTLITLARKKGYEVIGVLLGSGNRRDEARELLDYSFANLNQL